MNTLWHKIWVDLWLYKSRTILAIASIAAGVFCVGTLFGMIDLQLGKMDAAHKLSRPSHISLILRHDADIGLLNRILALKDVADVDIMTPISVRFKLPDRAEWDIGTLIFRPDYGAQRFDKTTRQSGSWPEGELLAVERLTAEAAELHVGDRIDFETADGATKLFTIGGIVRHPFVKPPNFGGQLHFFASAASAELFGVRVNTFRQLLVQIAPPYSEDKARQVAHAIRDVLNENAVGVNVTLLQEPEKHWGRPFFAGVNVVLRIMALTALVLASVLILNTMSAHVAQQSDQIGIMKALGGKTLIIVKLYLTETLLIALAAILLAAPPSLAAAYFSSCRLLDLFNIDCGDFDFSMRSVLYMLVGGLLAPLLAAMGPILRAASMTVRIAIDSYGLGSDFGLSRFDRWIESLGEKWLPTLYAAALGNLFRRKGRLMLTQSVLLIAGVMFLVLLSLIASVNLTLDNEMARSRYAVRLAFSGDPSAHKVIDLARSVADTQGVEIWQRLPMEITRHGRALRQKGSLGAQLLAVPAATAMYRPMVEQGRWLQGSDAGRRMLVLSADTAALNGIEVGDSVEVRFGKHRREWQVVGLYRWLAGAGYAVEPVYAPLETVQDITGRKDTASFALLDAPITTSAQEADYLRTLKQTFNDNGITLDVYNTAAKLKQRHFARNQFMPVIGTLSGLAAMIAAVGGIGLSGALAIGVLQRIREIGVLRAIGAPSRAIFRLFLLEGLLHGVVAWLLSVPLAYLVAEPVARELGETMLGAKLDFVFDIPAAGYWLGIVLILSWLAAYLPARKAARLTIKASLGH